jgi:hypothetical protein
MTRKVLFWIRAVSLDLGQDFAPFSHLLNFMEMEKPTMSQLSNSAVLKSELCQEISEGQGEVLLGGFGPATGLTPSVGQTNSAEVVASLAPGATPEAKAASPLSSISGEQVLQTIFGIVGQSSAMWQDPNVLNFVFTALNPPKA